MLQATEGDAGRESGSGSGGLVGVREEAGARAPLVVATLKALGALSDDAFRRHLVDIFPRLTRLIGCIRAPPEIQRALQRPHPEFSTPLCHRGFRVMGAL